jgi:hypothetical protein
VEQFFQELLKTLGTVAIVVAAATWLTKSIITHVLSRNIEAYKDELKHESEKEIEGLKSRLQIAALERQITFNRLHEKRAEVISEIYRRVMILEIWLNHVVAETELPDEAFTSPEKFANAFEPVFGHISLNLQDLAAYFNLNRLYLGEVICQKILSFHDEVLDSNSIYGYFYERFKQVPEEQISEVYGKNLRDRAHRVLRQVSDSRRAVEDEFRGLLGIIDKDDSSDIQARTDNSLMWIPAPETIDPLKWPKRGNE